MSSSGSAGHTAFLADILHLYIKFIKEFMVFGSYEVNIEWTAYAVWYIKVVKYRMF